MPNQKADKEAAVVVIVLVLDGRNFKVALFMCKPLLHYFAPTWIVCRFAAIDGRPFGIKYQLVLILEVFDGIYHVHLGPSGIALEFYYYEAPVSLLLYVMWEYQLL